MGTGRHSDNNEINSKWRTLLVTNNIFRFHTIVTKQTYRRPPLFFPMSTSWGYESESRWPNASAQVVQCKLSGWSMCSTGKRIFEYRIQSRVKNFLVIKKEKKNKVWIWNWKDLKTWVQILNLELKIEHECQCCDSSVFLNKLKS